MPRPLCSTAFAMATACVACAGAPAPEAPPPPVAEVTVPDDAPVTPSADADPDLEPIAVAAPPTAAVDLSECAAKLRSGAATPATDTERGVFQAAFDAERDGDLRAARLHYFELVKRHPNSRLVPLVYLAFGELFAAEAENDASKRPLAQSAYLEALKYPPRRGPLTRLALLIQERLPLLAESLADTMLQGRIDQQA